MKFITKNAFQTKKVAFSFLKKIFNLTKKRKNALVIALFGDLGAGKTVFVQGLAAALNIKKRIVSPTFVLMKKFQIPNFKNPVKSKLYILNFKNLYHIDAYRLKKEKDILTAVNWKEIVKNPENIILIEWPERIKKILPRNSIRVYLKHLDKNKREIKIIGKLN